ncbi:MAG: type II toxin-antitoxin system VapC family toxin [Oscillatoria sp. SIO1A7]|nr:type II toxin-antitoxin system VapC family toxin [Oscillatoria sp. SIO1A7]
MNFLCDTNIVSELARLKPNPGVVEWFAGVSSVALSAVTVEEIFYGLASKPKPAVQSWFEQFLDSRCRVLPITAQIAKRSGQMRGKLRSQGRPRTQPDMMIAATAEIYNLTLVTRNTRDFEGCGISLLNPFT